MAGESTPSLRNSVEIGLLHEVDIDNSPNIRENAILRRGMDSTSTSTPAMLIATTLHHLGVLATTSEVLFGRHRLHHDASSCKILAIFKITDVQASKP